MLWTWVFLFKKIQFIKIFIEVSIDPWLAHLWLHTPQITHFIVAIWVPKQHQDHVQPHAYKVCIPLIMKSSPSPLLSYLKWIIYFVNNINKIIFFILLIINEVYYLFSYLKWIKIILNLTSIFTKIFSHSLLSIEEKNQSWGIRIFFLSISLKQFGRRKKQCQ